MNTIQATVAAQLRTMPHEVVQAHRNGQRALSSLRHSLYSYTHEDTARRIKLRALLDGAGLADSTVSLSFIKANGEVRLMACIPCPGCDATARYVTVVDLELTHAAGREVFRRVCLDTIAAINIDHRCTDC